MPDPIGMKSRLAVAGSGPLNQRFRPDAARRRLGTPVVAVFTCTSLVISEAPSAV